MEVCEGHNLSIAEGVVTLLGEGDPSFFERAEEVEEFKVCIALQGSITCGPVTFSTAASTSGFDPECTDCKWLSSAHLSLMLFMAV